MSDFLGSHPKNTMINLIITAFKFNGVDCLRLMRTVDGEKTPAPPGIYKNPVNIAIKLSIKWKKIDLSHQKTTKPVRLPWDRSD